MVKIQTISKSFKIINWKLLLAIFLTLLIPSVYEISKVYFVGEIQSSYSFSIAGNLNWINVAFEVLEEAFLLPLFFVLRNYLKKKNSNKQIIGKIYLISIIYIIFIIMCIIFTKELLNFMNARQKTQEVLNFVRVELLSKFFQLFMKLILIFLISKNKWKQAIIFFTIKTLLNIILDFFVVGDNSFSLKLGIVWIAWNQLIVSFVISFIGIFMVVKTYKMKANDFIHPQIFSQLVGWKQTFWNGAESFIRNAFFIWFVLKTINTLPSEYNQGDFWVMNIFIWNWLLLPIIAISQYINRDQAFRSETHSLKERLIAPIIIATFTIILWFATIPAWEGFIKVIMNNDNYKIIAHLALVSIGFYVIFAYNNIIDKLFLGSGKAHLLFWQSLITNIVVFIPYYYFASINKLEDIVIMIGLAIGVDSILTFGMFLFNYKNINKKIQTT